MKKLAAFSLVFVTLIVFGVVPAFAQLGSANLQGTIRDDKGSPLPGVTVTAKNVDTGLERSDVTAPTGEYRIPSLPFGVYDITAQISSFATQVKTGIQLDVGRTVSVDFAMRLSATAEVIEVKAETPLIERTESHVSTVVTPEQVKSLPLNGRQFGNLAALAPGTQLKVNADPTRPNNLAVVLLGGSGRNYNTTIDGGDNNDDTIGGINQFFPLDAVAEFNFLTNRYKAEYGRSNGGVLNVVTKSGTNDFHGSFFSFFRNDKLNSLTTTEKNSHFEDPAPYDRKQYGGSIGGPIVKDRAHFFFSADRAQIDQQDVLISDFTPEPSLNGQVVPDATRETLYLGKVTASINPRQFLTVRYGQQKTNAPYGVGPTYAPSARGIVNNTFHSLLASHNYVITENKLNEFVFQYADFKDFIAPTSDAPTELFSSFYVGQNQSTPQTTQQKKYQFKDDFSWSMGGNHHFKTGVNFVHEPTLGGTFSFGTTGQYFYLGNDRDSGISLIQIFGGNSTQNTGNNQYGFYGQDDWNVNDHLTLNLGLRYDLVTGFDAVTQVNSPLYHALTQVPFDFPWLGPVKANANGQISDDKNNIQPRVGFAYDLNADGITVVRGGWGRYYDFPYTNANVLFLQGALVGFGVTYSNTDPEGIRNPNGSLFHIGDPLPPNQITGSSGPSPNEAVSPDFAVPYTNQLSFGFSRQLSESSAVDVDYARVSFRDQYIRYRINGTVNGQKILPDFGNVRFWSNEGFADYNGVSVSYRHRLSKKFQFAGSYTLSKIDGNTLPGSDEFRVAQARNLGNCRDCVLDFTLGPKEDPRQKGPLDTDARHIVILSGIYDLPADFQVTGFLRANSKRPFNIYQKINTGSGFAYSLPAGVDHVNSDRATGFSQVDMRVSKKFHIKDTVDVEGILEVFNVFNAKNPNSTYTVGDINSATFRQQTFFAGDPESGDQRLAQLGFRIEF